MYQTSIDEIVPVLHLSITEVHMKFLDSKMTMTKCLNEIGGVSVSEIFTSDATTSKFTVDASKKLQESVLLADCPNHEQLDFTAIFDMPERCMSWPFNEVNNMGTESYPGHGLIEEALLNSNDAFFNYEIQQTRPLDERVDICNYWGVADADEYYNPYLFLMSLLDLPEMVSPYSPILSQRESQKRLPITLVLDLDETLVHSSFDSCEDADFSFPVHFSMQVQTVYVRQRPYLRMFLEAVAAMFEIVIFTAGQSIYAERLLDILDPDHTLICQRVYRDSCVLSEGGYMKDLTILGRDLARIAIVDNSPQVFQLQVENGIPIQSWFGDPSDNALLSLFLFLESLVGADDVRPIIKKKFCCQE
ncbi:hypothetical protein HHK36_020902 [Tetracentron sinense]|uniref:FCP1 homology domain-containing protein n=1 Tax=Tetracentron sinense TaxID=13715 RepID=A0A834YUV8_TETSI|nr:hypothetical protein HHK36_020902 [Tetracentron sinense]